MVPITSSEVEGVVVPTPKRPASVKTKSGLPLPLESRKKPSLKPIIPSSPDCPICMEAPERNRSFQRSVSEPMLYAFVVVGVRLLPIWPLNVMTSEDVSPSATDPFRVESPSTVNDPFDMRVCAAVMLEPEMLPTTSNASPGLLVPIPRRLFVSSQNRFVLSWLTTPPTPAKSIDP